MPNDAQTLRNLFRVELANLDQFKIVIRAKKWTRESLLDGVAEQGRCQGLGYVQMRQKLLRKIAKKKICGFKPEEDVQFPNPNSVLKVPFPWISLAESYDFFKPPPLSETIITPRSIRREGLETLSVLVVACSPRANLSRNDYCCDGNTSTPVAHIPRALPPVRNPVTRPTCLVCSRHRWLSRRRPTLYDSSGQTRSWICLKIY
ncbi:hypothetical protein J6590_003832 [Homalodisca vitripennis]|nr:hypothetical protein J6590_003832 [Homalodisca vitripennis]